MPGLAVIFFCSGLFVYWIARTALLIFASREAIEESLACDLWWGRRVLDVLRSAMSPPQQLLG
jgi:hypothetical protein